MGAQIELPGMPVRPVHQNLAEALAAAQAEFPDIPKNRTATVKGSSKSGTAYEYTYSYADFADVLKVVRPVLAKHGLAFYQPIRRKEVKAYLTSVLKHVSGESIESDGLPIAEIMNPQELGSQLSYWRRYDGCSLLGIQPDEDEDGRRAALGTSKATKGDRFAKQDEKMEKQAQENKISARDIRGFWSAVSSSGKTMQEVKQWLKDHRYNSVEEITKEGSEEAIKWAVSGGTVAPKDMAGVLAKSIDLRRDAAMKTLFAVAGEFHIPVEDVKTASYERYKVDSMTKLTTAQLSEMAEWVKGVAQEQTA